MIAGIGIDVVHVRRLERWRAIPGLLERYFHPDELQTALSRGAAAALSLSARFAAKEAFGKALGTGVAVPATLHAVAVAHDARGKPEYRYDERLAAHMRDNGLRAHLSISDEDEHIVAFALIERCGD